MLTFSGFSACGDHGSSGFSQVSHEIFYLSNSVYQSGLNKIIFLDTTAGEFGIDVAENPEPGNTLIFIDIGGNLKLEPVRLYHLNKVFGQAVLLSSPSSPNNVPYLRLSQNYASYRFIYVNDMVGWVYDITYLNIEGSDNPVAIENTNIVIQQYLSNINVGTLIGNSFNGITGLSTNFAPLMDGSANVGGSSLVARQDHIHPSDTSKASLNSPAFTGIPTAPTASLGNNSTQIATTGFVANAVAGLSGGGVSTNSPAFIGTPTAPTASPGTNSTQLATTAFVANATSGLASTSFVTSAISGFANIASPSFTGIPTAPTATAGTNTTQLATTAFVANAISGLSGGGVSANSPAFTGIPTAPTASLGNNSTQLATTAFVANAISGFASINSPEFMGIPTAPTATAGNNSYQLANTAFVTSAIAVALGTIPEPTIIELTTTSTTPAIVTTYNVSDIRTVKFDIQATSGSNYTVTTIMVIHDGTIPTILEDSPVSIGSSVGTFDCDITGGFLRLVFTPASSNSTSLKVIPTVITLGNSTTGDPEGTISATTSSTTPTVVASYATSSIRTAKFEIQLTSGSNYTITNIIAIHDGITPTILETAPMMIGSSLGSFDCEIVGGNLRLVFTPISSSQTFLKILPTTIGV